jgi:Spy/CpxP family protein refolding chaperone
MKKKKMSSVVFSIAIICSGLLAAQAWAFGPPPPGGVIPPLDALLELDLSDSQKVEVLNIINKYREEEKELNAQLQAAREETEDVIQAEPFDEEKVRLAFRQISPIMEDIMVLKTKIMAELKAVLNSDQLNLLEEKREERFKRMEGGMQLGE